MSSDDDPHGRLIVSFENWEGPLDLLLNLARQQKIDLATIPIGPLVDQYLAFVGAARALRLELAADYLVMAAWLAYLKSALLLPVEARPEPDPEDMAVRLRWRLQKLDAMRDAARRLMEGDLLGRDTFPRGTPEGLGSITTRRADATLYQLLSAYGSVRSRPDVIGWTPPERKAVVTLEQALERLRAVIGDGEEWRDLRQLLWPRMEPALARSSLASGFVAALELARTGQVEISQTHMFGPLLLRSLQDQKALSQQDLSKRSRAA